MLTRRARSKRHVQCALFVCTMLLFLPMGFLAPPASATLPENRRYEQVSPEFKAGYPVFASHGTVEFALDGESSYFTSVGAFAGSGQNFALNPYLAKREATGWRTTGLFPFQEGACWAGLEEMAPDLSRFEYKVNQGGCGLSPSATIGVREPDGLFAEPFPTFSNRSGEGMPVNVDNASPDFTHLILAYVAAADRHMSPLTPADEAEEGIQLVELSNAGLRLVAIDNQDKQMTRYCRVELGGRGGAFNAVSQPAASEVFFSVPIGTQSGGSGLCEQSIDHPLQLFLRANGERTVTISAPLAADCTEDPCASAARGIPAEAVFQGASQDGSRVFFTTTQPFVNGDKDQTNDLYMATIGCAGGLTGEACGPSAREVTDLTRISEPPSAGEPAEVEPQAVSLSPDGSHVYFVARGVLTDIANSEGDAAVRGAENLYVYVNKGASSGVSFIADLCSGGEASGAASDPRCPNTAANDAALWMPTNEKREAQTTADGRFLVFSTVSRLIGKGPELDADSARDVYRYDAQTGQLLRVSIGERGWDGNGNGDGFNAAIAPVIFRGSIQDQFEMGARAITEDGSKIVFRTAESLSSAAANGQPDVYIWHDGQVGLISSGSSVNADEEPVITPLGRDVFFLSSAALAAGDTDGLRDVYDARVDGGFPEVEAPVEQCSADACQGALSTPAPVPAPGTASQPADVLAQGVKAAAPARAHVKRKRRKAKHAKRVRRRTRRNTRGGAKR